MLSRSSNISMTEILDWVVANRESNDGITFFPSTLIRSSLWNKLKEIFKTKTRYKATETLQKALQLLYSESKVLSSDPTVSTKRVRTLD